jgi:hypothetical protein
MALAAIPQVMAMRPIHRRADPLQDKIAWHFTRNVAKEERSHAQRVGVWGKAEVLVHGERREADIHPVDEAQQIQQEDQRQQPPGDGANGRALDVFDHDCPPVRAIR